MKHGGEGRGTELRQRFMLMYKGIQSHYRGGCRMYGVAVIVGPRSSPSIPAVQLFNEILLKITFKVKNKVFNF